MLEYLLSLESHNWLYFFGIIVAWAGGGLFFMVMMHVGKTYPRGASTPTGATVVSIDEYLEMQGFEPFDQQKA